MMEFILIYYLGMNVDGHWKASIQVIFFFKTLSADPISSGSGFTAPMENEKYPAGHGLQTAAPAVILQLRIMKTTWMKSGPASVARLHKYLFLSVCLTATVCQCLLN